MRLFNGLHTLCLLAALATGSRAFFYEGENVQTFLTRPGQATPFLDILKTSPEPQLTPGYLFIGPNPDAGRPAASTPHFSAWQFGPLIYDQQGNLVWAGNHTCELQAWNFLPCPYGDDTLLDHLCFGDAGLFVGRPLDGRVRILDNTYAEVQRHGPAGGLLGPDGHELNFIDAHTFIEILYVSKPRDLSPFGGVADSWYLECCFQQRGAFSGLVQFQWCASDWISLGESYWMFQDFTEHSPWDWFHMNSVDIDDAGDYYVLGKDMMAIYKIAGLRSAFGKPGRVIWRFGGKNSSFEMDNGLNISIAHHARIHAVGPRFTRLSFFHNINVDQSSTASSGKYIELDNLTMTASLKEEYIHPGWGYSSVQGSVQLLPNGNSFIGWGRLQEISEHAPGLPETLLFRARYGEGLALESYRNFKYEWKGYPRDPPDVFAYALNCSSNLMVYMSWNGATEYKGWRVFGAAAVAEAKAEQLGEGDWARMGYETVADVGDFQPDRRFVFVQALDADGKILSNSHYVPVFVPSVEFTTRHGCNSTRCIAGTDYNAANSIIDMC